MRALRLGLDADVHLAVVRIAVFSMWAWMLITFDAGRVAGMPSDIVQPPGLFDVASFRALVGSAFALECFHVVAVAGCVASALGLRPFAPVAAITWIGILLMYATWASVGAFYNHAQLAVLLTALMLVAAPCADRLSVCAAPGRTAMPSSAYRTSVNLMAIIVSATYAMTGLRRFGDGGVTVFADESMEIWVVSRTLEYSAFEFDIGLAVLREPLFGDALRAALIVSTVFEVLSPLAVCFRRFRLVWLLVIVGFHLGTLVLMRIFFWENVVLVLAIFAPMGASHSAGLPRSPSSFAAGATS